jgi:ABC-2 type transport system permease protein/lipopolysaccharide transport system permease protein
VEDLGIPPPARLIFPFLGLSGGTARPLPVVQAVAQIPDAPPPELRFRRRLGLVRAFREIWSNRQLIVVLTERELRARYKQAVLGFAWAVLAPLALMVVFTLFVKRVIVVETGDVPYPLFAFMGLLPWSFFSTSISFGGQSLIQNLALLNKVYCPREVFPLASIGVAALDGVIGVAILGGIMLVYWEAPQATTIWVPVILAVQVAFTVGATLWMSSVIVYLRDLRHALPLLLQLGLFATPVAFGLEAIPEDVQPYYSAFNPLGPVIDGYRRAILFGDAPQLDLLGIASVSAVVVLVSGYIVFKRLEAGLADVA